MILTNMDEEDEKLQRFGTPLEPLPEDEIPSKKPISIEDQIVTDENGKRRFHGAFTGGFSAGFWNTVGSSEGWKPSEFKSSRSEKAPQRAQQKPEDFMDDEDLGEFGIAPQRIQAQNDFQIETAKSSRKRKLFQSSLGNSGAIPGMPVLAELLRPVEDKIAVRILKSMGWKPGQGIGPRLTSKQKKKTHERNKREEYVLRRYGCATDDNEDKKIELPSESSEDDDGDESELTFAPDDYDSLVCASKTNRFGLGYSGLSHDTSSDSKPAHFNLFGQLEMIDKNNQKLSIRGQAFGVGALEDEDEDIYARDDLSKYDFTLESQKPKRKAEKPVQDRHIIEGFAAAKHEVQFQAPFIVETPDDFQPRNWAMRKSRFEPLAPNKLREIEEANAYKRAGLGRHDLNPAQRGTILDDPQPKDAAPLVETIQKNKLEELQAAQRKRDERTKSLLEKITARSDNFTCGGIINTKGEEEMVEIKNAVEQENKNLLAKASSKTKSLGSTILEGSAFKPFLGNEGKQQRYEKFLEADLKDEKEISVFLATIQPVELSEWDREMECKEFIQARKIYKPLGGIMSDRFVSEATLSQEKAKVDANKQDNKTEKNNKIVIKRSKEMWKPHAILCKRYNIPEPFGGNLEETELKPAKRAKLSIFEYLETSINRKDNFQTPVIIPKHIEKPKAIVHDRTQVDLISIQAEQKSKETQSSQEKAEEMPQTSAQKVSSDTKYFKMPPKTELEKRVEESRDKPPSEKVELFRAIFEDSDDEPEEQTPSTDLTKKSVLEIDKLELPSTKPMSAAEANLLRNNSPPRGIFAALFTAKTVVETPNPIDTESSEPKSEKVASDIPVKIHFKSRIERQQTTIDEEASYGPKLPAHLELETNKSPDDALDSRPMSLFEKHKSKALLKDVWVERTNDGNEKSSSDSSSDSSSTSDSDDKRRKKKTKKNKKSSEKIRHKKKSKKLKKKAKTKKKSKKKKGK